MKQVFQVWQMCPVVLACSKVCQVWSSPRDCSTAYQSQIDLRAPGAVPYSRHAGCTQMASQHLICGARGPCEEKLGSSMSRTQPIPEKRTNGTRNVSPRKRGGLITINVYSISSGTTRPKIYLKQPKFISKLKTRSEENGWEGHCQDRRMEQWSWVTH